MSNTGNKRIEIDARLCKSCGICIEMCPKQVFTRDLDGKATKDHPECCVFCGICETMCPDFAIRLVEED